MSDPAYRLPAAMVLLPHAGPYQQCPQCGASPVRCDKCGHVTTAIHLPPGYWRAHCGHWQGERIGEPEKYVVDGRYVNAEPGDPLDRPPIYLTFTRGTNLDRVCSPQRRVRYGFLWLRKCREQGVHVHQRCERCLWQGIALADGGT